MNSRNLCRSPRSSHENPSAPVCFRGARFLLGAVLLAGLLAPFKTQAATVVWEPVQGISADSDVDVSGSLVQAIHFGDTNTYDVNGVSFLGFVPSGLSTETSGAGEGQLKMAASAGWSSFTYMSAEAPFTGLSAGYQGVLGHATYMPLTDPVSLTIEGLSVGETYVVQFWMNFSAAIPNYTETFTATNTSGALNMNPSGVDGGLGQFVTGTFTADATTQVITSQPNVSFVLNAYQLRSVVPEPSALLLIGAGLTLIPLRRFRHA